MRCRFSTESAERSRVSPGLLGPWRWRGWNLESLKERVASGESEDSLDSATARRTHVADRCVLNWSILLAVLVRSGSAFRPFGCFLLEARCRALRGKRLDGRGAGQQRECCDKFVTHVTELSQKKVFAKCLKPFSAMRPESCGPRSPKGQRSAASLLDAMAALPRKWDSDGAASLPFGRREPYWRSLTIAAVAAI